MAVAPGTYKHSSRWLNFCPCTYPGAPGPGPGPGKKRRRSLASGLAWVLLGLVWLGSPLIIGCRTEDSNNQISKNQKNKFSQRTSDSNLINIDRRSIIAGIGCPNCLYNKDNTFSISFLSSSKKTKQKQQQKPLAIVNSKRKSINHKQNHQKRHQKRKKPQNLNIDVIRLESIKHQILTKLGLKHKPNVTQHYPKQVIIDTIMRAGEKNFNNDKSHESDLKRDSVQMEEPEPDDFYGRTREIISFAERGKLLVFCFFFPVFFLLLNILFG